MICKWSKEGSSFHWCHLAIPTALCFIRFIIWVSQFEAVSCNMQIGPHSWPALGIFALAPAADSFSNRRNSQKQMVRVPLQQSVCCSGEVASSETGCRLNNPPFLKRVVPKGQGWLQWGGSVRGSWLRGCFHKAWTMNKFSLLYSPFPSISHSEIWIGK